MKKVMVCKELSWNVNDNYKIYYYEVPEEWAENVNEGDFVYKIRLETENQVVEIIQVIKLDFTTNFSDNLAITVLSENERVHLVSDEYFVAPIKEFLKKYCNKPIRELKKLINILIKETGREISNFRMNHLSNARKKYLLKLFYTEDINEFYNDSEKVKTKWFKECNDFELNFIHIINLVRLKEIIDNLIEENKSIDDKEKIALRKEYFNKLDIMTSSIKLKGINRYKLDAPVGIDFSLDGKYLILGKLTPREFYLNIFSFWNIVKSLLTVSFIPILVVLLDSDKKIIIYFFLGFVYLIALVLSDEKQTDNIIDFMSQVGDNNSRQLSYAKLFYTGVITVLVFVIFSVQVVFIPGIVDSIKKSASYLVGDILLAITGLIIILGIVELSILFVTGIESTVFYIKRAKKLGTIISFCFSIVFWILSDYCIYNILEVNKQIDKQTLEWQTVIFAIASMIAVLQILRSIYEFREKIKDNYKKAIE